MQMIGGTAMGGPWVLMAASDMPETVLAAQVQHELDAVNAAMSPWDPQSELNRISATPADQPVVLSAPMAQVLGFALTLQRLSGGVFDPTLGGEVSRAGFGPPGKTRARGALRLCDRVLWRTAPVMLDLCAVAKGYAVDRAAAALERLGVQNFLLNVTGDLIARGTHPGGGPWRLGVELPIPDQQVIFRNLDADGAIATSGNYRRQRDAGRQSHLISGLTGESVAHGLIGVSVLADQAMVADGWATTLALLGPSKGTALARQQGLSALFITEAEGGFTEQIIGNWPCATPETPANSAEKSQKNC